MTLESLELECKPGDELCDLLLDESLIDMLLVVWFDRPDDMDWLCGLCCGGGGGWC